jgi:hydroxymethylglutaryl-CoA lyase
VEFTALVPNTRGAERAVAAGICSVEYVVSAADGHSRANTGRSSATSLNEVGSVAATAHAAGGACEVVLAVAWDCPFDGPTPPGRVVQMAARAVELGADRVCLADTIGTVTPGRMSHLLERVRGACSAAPVGIHLHDTRGAGLATAFAAMQLGVLDLDASIGGLGGCPFAPGASGNIATEELAYLCTECGVETGLDLEALIAAARLAQEIVGRPLSSSVLRAGVRRTAGSDARL